MGGGERWEVGGGGATLTILSCRETEGARAADGVKINGLLATDGVNINGLLATDGIKINGLLTTDGVKINGLLAAQHVPAACSQTRACDLADIRSSGQLQK